MKLHEAISICCERVAVLGEAFDADDVVRCLKRDFSEEITTYSNRLVDADLKRRATTELKRRGGLDHLDHYEQLNLEGFEDAPATVPFYEGDKVRYISTLRATEGHLLAAIKLRVDNIKFCRDRLDEYEAMLIFLRAHRRDDEPFITFGQALERRRAGVYHAG